MQKYNFNILEKGDDIFIQKRKGITESRLRVAASIYGTRNKKKLSVSRGEGGWWVLRVR